MDYIVPMFIQISEYLTKLASYSPACRLPHIPQHSQPVTNQHFVGLPTTEAPHYCHHPTRQAYMTAGDKEADIARQVLEGCATSCRDILCLGSGEWRAGELDRLKKEVV